MKIFVLSFLIKVYRKIVPKNIRNKIGLRKKMHINENIAKQLYEYAFGYLKPNHVKMKFYLKDYVQREIYLTGDYEKDDCFALLNIFLENGIFLDIGANIGVYSFVFYKKAKHIYAFEATKKTFDCLCETIEINNIKNITPVFAAVHCRDREEIAIYADFPDNCGGNSMHIGYNIANTVMSITIDNYVLENDITNIAMIKMDIEGNELNAFKGMQKTLMKFRPIVFCEINPSASKNAGYNVIELFNYVIDNCNYLAKIRKNGKYKEIDVKYIGGIQDSINCYFFPK